jgi:ubiquitin-conjugating enzyme E2 I
MGHCERCLRGIRLVLRRKRANGTTDLFSWEAGVPGKAGTSWEGGVYRIKLQFPEDFPAKPPKCQFSPPLFHPNVYPSGTICLSILDEAKTWEPSLGVLDILKGIQQLLNEPNLGDPAQREAYNLLK